ncbi:triose-phosphate isomerase [Candidatus Woesearchaeota archaeon CG06_land_8_20_14_3_00_33_13]|nr:MAG: triose-phosphate isomerase [Candidatus Woesearchaeota archaeon CG10_big_fil_rev_8_21_14_0_10_33_12]PIU72282.1 MAG: triose-phosphate isomerase [Candidatus Woesearchaeota archaeon CG06_land_8_20_14_3_00_33_13]
MLKTPIIIVNFKTYKESTGDNAIKLAEICNKTAKETKTSIAIAVQSTDIYKISKIVSIPVLSQHIDAIDFGKNTGFLLPESIKQAGAEATLLNHSEHRLDFELLKIFIERAKQAGLKTIVCAKDVEDAKKIAGLSPDFIAVEPPELIGGKISVSEAKPEVISDSVKAIKSINKKIKVLCGAGIHNKDDVKKAVKLGADGILVASGIVKAGNQEAALKDLVDGLI